ncbi:hypothetical protein AB5J62_13070 [Amycolatopsis sp. cg5]|uniref:hypothetical protein n=1 Tax=Amycolatopsis sp. cg5 TaxID=3238802 RepID=UPI0035254F03
MDASEAGDGRRRPSTRLILVMTAVVIVAIAVTVYLTVHANPQATADGTAEEIADVMTSGDDPALRALFCPRDSGLPPVPVPLVTSATPVSVSAIEVKDDVAGVLLTRQRDRLGPFGVLLVRSDNGNWCVFGFKTCIATVTAATILKPQYTRFCS